MAKKERDQIRSNEENLQTPLIEYQEITIISRPQTKTTASVKCSKTHRPCQINLTTVIIVIIIIITITKKSTIHPTKAGKQHR
jgi:hypothetical protein